MIMKRIFLISAVLLVLAACSPVLTREVMKQGMRDVSFNQLRQDPAVYKGKLFILGGVIAETRFSEKGSQIEALSVPVDSLGYLQSSVRHKAGSLLCIRNQKDFSTRWCLRGEGRSRWQETL